MSLPLFLDLGEIRIVHAAWIPYEIEKIKKWTSDGLNLTEELLQKSSQKGTEEYDAIDRVLKGLEIPLPKDADPLPDKEKNACKEIPIRWWEPAADKSYGEVIFPTSSLDCADQKIEAEKTDGLSYYSDPVPVFFGHYWRHLKKHQLKVQADHICCLDYSVANGGSLVAYRWDGENTLRNDHFESVQ